jgi:protein involved in sex pheromone biosynthesis
MKKVLALCGAAFVASVFALSGCANDSNSSNEAKLANQVTRAIYNNDISGVTSNFDSTLAAQVTRASVGALSDKMHALGNYQGLTEAAMDIPSHRYTFDAKFDKGDMTVGMRLDASGKIAAYRVVPGTPK